jgi:crotonobetainyl-CoA:carnitine CoA-transferase CaiB-like acyl-CoA transferase
MTGPLSDLRIVDLTTVVMGPYATQLLGDLGANVIKVEAPSGDTTRKTLPMRNPDMSWSYLGLNRNKRSIVLDLKQTDGISALLKIVETADVVISNVRPKALDRLGISYDRLKQANPKIIYVSLIGFNEDGPYAGQPVYEDLIQGLTAVPSILVDAGSPRPHFVPVSFNDRGVGLHAAVSLLAAVHWRDKSGRGQHLEIPMFETMVPFSTGGHAGGMAFEPPMGPPGYKRTLTDQRGPYKTMDGFICIIVYTDNHWRSFLKLIGKAELFTTDARFRDFGSRTEYSHELYPLLIEAMATKTTAEWLKLFKDGDIPATPLHTLESIYADPHLVATDFYQVVEHPTEGKIRQMSIAEKWTETPPTVRSLPPLLGEHSIEILQEAGVPDDQVQRMLDNKVTRQAVIAKRQAAE